MHQRCDWSFEPSSTQADSLIIPSLSGLARLSVSRASAADKRRFSRRLFLPELIQHNLETLSCFITLPSDISHRNTALLCKSRPYLCIRP